MEAKLIGLDVSACAGVFSAADEVYYVGECTGWRPMQYPGGRPAALQMSREFSFVPPGQDVPTSYPTVERLCQKVKDVCIDAVRSEGRHGHSGRIGLIWRFERLMTRILVRARG